MSRTPQRTSKPRPAVLGHNVPDIDAAQRLTQALADQADRDSRRPRASVTVDLVVGDNTVNHRLGIVPRGCSLMPTVADASFAWALKTRDDKQVVITVLGVAQPNAVIEVWT